jgi:hypothetical protein
MPFVHEDHGNYLMKIKVDVQHYAESPLGKYFYFASANKIDPFLITASMDASSQAVGGGVRGLRQRGNNVAAVKKMLLPVSDQMIKKANACQEILMLEKE